MTESTLFLEGQTIEFEQSLSSIVEKAAGNIPTIFPQ
jgi:hypothetical protein